MHRNNQSYNNEFLRNFVVLFSGNIASRVILILGTPLLARYFSPGEVGQWQIYLALLAILVPLTSWKYEIAIVLPETDSGANNVLTAGILLSLASTAAWVVIFVLISQAISDTVKVPFIASYGWTLPIIAWLYSIEQFFSYWFTRKHQFKSQVPSSIVRSISMIGIPISLVLFIEETRNELIIGSIFAQLLATSIICALFVNKYWKSLDFKQHTTELSNALVKYKNYPFYVTPYTLLSQISTRLLIFIVAYYATTHEVGLFAMSLQLTLIPVTFISLSLSKVIFPKLSKHLASSITHRLITNLQYIIVIISVPWATFFVFYTSELFGILLGPEWKNAGKYAAWLTGPSMILLFTAWLNRVYDVAGKQKLEFALQLTYSVILFASIFYSLYVGKDTLFSVALYSIITVCFNIVWLIVAYNVAGIQTRQLIGPLKLGFLLLVLSVGICLVVNRYASEFWGIPITFLLLLILQIASAVTYLRQRKQATN